MNNSKKQTLLVIVSLVVLLIGVITIGSVIGAKSSKDTGGTTIADVYKRQSLSWYTMLSNSHLESV